MTIKIAILGIVWGCCPVAVEAAQTALAPDSYPDAACKVKSVRQEATAYENAVTSPNSDLFAATQEDSKGVYQVFTGKPGSGDLRCISCTERAGLPRRDRNKPMISWHPSGKWLVVGAEQDTHGNMWMPASWKRGLLQSGIWLNMWLVSPDGKHWYQQTDFKKPAHGPSDGFVGTAFSPDGKKAAWTEIVDGNVLANAFGVWRLFVADFTVSRDGVPSLVNRRDITPAGAKWVEPGNFSPDGRSLLISSDAGMKDALGQDQFVLDIVTGKLTNLNSSPQVWDEHGLYSPDGRKISFMSSYPYRAESGSNKTAALKTEFMLMDADGGNLQQVTHFNTPGFPESQKSRTIAAVAGFGKDGTQLFASLMTTDKSFKKTNWTITFEGPCGNMRQAATPPVGRR
ncbi:MAG: hypothetical protein ABI759_02825 [Candidatus Solibacter sp.]